MTVPHPRHGGSDPRGLAAAGVFQDLPASVRWLLAVGGVLLGTVPALAADAARRPNIVFILADDLGYGDLGCYGQKKIKTPVLDRLAAQGQRFTQAYAGSTVCAPSRCALMTGKHTGHGTVRGNALVPLGPGDVTLAEILKRCGYVTGLVGKWGLGEAGSTGVPNRKGFDSFYGYLNQVHAHNSYPDFLWQNEQKVPLPGNVVKDNVALQKAQYSNDLFTTKALEFVEKNKANPFFLYLAYTIPHANNERGRGGANGLEVPSDAPYSDQPWPQAQKNYAAMITRMDRDIGRILERLREVGLDENTIVFFASDNGPHREGGGDPAFFHSSGPLRGFKRSLHEGGVRIPMIVRWSGKIRPGVSDQVWAFWDVLPTVAELAGGKTPPGLDGFSVVPTLLGKSGQRQHEFLYWEFHEGGFQQAARTGNWKAVRTKMNAPLELYDLAKDLGEEHNVAAQQPQVVARIEAYLRTARTESAHWPIKPAKKKPAPKVEFQRDIRPILAAHCLKCHGSEKRRGGLLLTDRKSALLPSDSGKPAIVPGAGGQSELIRRVLTLDAEERMPPTGDRLSAVQIAQLRVWIDGGAAWPAEAAPTHWAYRKPKCPELPAVRDSRWLRNAIDVFVLARLEKEGLGPAPEADRARLLRRVYLDLIGLPPTVAQVDAFLQDTRPDAYERVVEELLASPHYGERWARPWLDLARYADSNGFQRDGFRDIWPYRDWVVRAFNHDMPFDRFTIEQLAGDLLPAATLEQQIATGFNRCTTINVEGGVDPEESRVNALFDRVSTTATVWLGTTMACAQCHNHKYDPFSQQDYYRLFAYFNSTLDEITQKGSTREFTGPTLTLPLDPALEGRRKQLQARRDALDKELRAAVAELAPALTRWEQAQHADAAKRNKLPPEVRTILAVGAGKRTVKQKQTLATYHADLQAEVGRLKKRLAELDAQLAPLQSPTSLVMVERATLRPTHLFKRGNFLAHGAAVTPGVPDALPALPGDAPANRLGLARWLVAADNPLVARVAVNRWWAELFGRGLVATPEDFGSQGEPPTHPELLDWLAAEFPRRGWSIKAMHRLMVTSATYRQSSRVGSNLLVRDPLNKLLGRGPRVRLDAETIRDNALAISDLLSRKVGGPPVRPPQPPGIWNVTGVVDNTYRPSAGADRYRRGLYTVWRRSSPYPSFVAFDAPDRASCVVQRSRTNTPLQALTLMNDPVYVEAAVALARRVLTDRPVAEVRQQVVYAFRLCLARYPTEEEVQILEQVHRRGLSRFEAGPAAARAVAGAQAMDERQLAAWFHVATVLLNLDETITKG